jgi:hypothetical protein
VFNKNSIEADKNGRICRCVDLDLPYVDVIIQSYEATKLRLTALVDTVKTVD